VPRLIQRRSLIATRESQAVNSFSIADALITRYGRDVSLSSGACRSPQRGDERRAPRGSREGELLFYGTIRAALGVTMKITPSEIR